MIRLHETMYTHMALSMPHHHIQITQWQIQGFHWFPGKPGKLEFNDGKEVSAYNKYKALDKVSHEDLPLN